MQPDRSACPPFSDAFRAELTRLLAWRRDVRRFRCDAVSGDIVESLLDAAQLSPSVGNSQPWRWVLVESAEARGRVQASFDRCNGEALAGYQGEKAALYARLKLEGLRDAPVQIAAFADHGTGQGAGLGRLTMPETLDYSVVSAIMSLWLAARARGLGLGWVSILEPGEVARALEVPETWRLVAYLCLGWPQEEHLDPELERHAWQARTSIGRTVLRR